MILLQGKFSNNDFYHSFTTNVPEMIRENKRRKLKDSENQAIIFFKYQSSMKNNLEHKNLKRHFKKSETGIVKVLSQNITRSSSPSEIPSVYRYRINLATVGAAVCGTFNFATEMLQGASNLYKRFPFSFRSF